MQWPLLEWSKFTCQEGQSVGSSVIELVAEDHQSTDQQNSKDDGAPQPPILLQLLPDTLPKSR